MPGDGIDVKITILLLDLPARPRGNARTLAPQVTPPPPDARLTRLPVQPNDVPSGHVFAGANFGLVPYSGTKPQAGDLIAVVGNVAQRYVTSPLAGEALRWPTFSGGCRCDCPGNAGIVVYSTTCRGVVNLIALDAQTGDVFQFFGMNELGGIGGFFNNNFMTISVAIDQAEPYDLWVADDRRFWSTRILDSQPTSTRGYFTLVRYVLSGGQYAPLSYVDLTDPGVVGQNEVDPPALGTNFLSVVEAVPHVALQKAPARYLTVEGAVITTHTLLRNGAPYPWGLRGNIVIVPQRPAQPAVRYAVATDGAATFQLLEFTALDVITRVIPLTGLSFSFHLAAFCNRLLILNGSVDEPV